MSRSGGFHWVVQRRCLCQRARAEGEHKHASPCTCTIDENHYDDNSLMDGGTEYPL